jgi:hypothetical protein
VHPSIKLVCIAFASTVLAAATGPIPAGEIYKVPLSGQAETNFAHPSGGTGDPDGLGAVTIAIYPTKRQVCFDFSLSHVATPMMAHIGRRPSFGTVRQSSRCSPGPEASWMDARLPTPGNWRT